MKSPLNLVVALIAICILAAACGEDEASEANAASGMLFGEEWSVEVGIASDAEHPSEERLSVVIFDADLGECGDPRGIEGTYRTASFTIPREVGSPSFPAVIFAKYTPGSPVATHLSQSTDISITELTDTRIRGTIDATYDDDNSISGEFSATICD